MAQMTFGILGSSSVLLVVVSFFFLLKDYKLFGIFISKVEADDCGLYTLQFYSGAKDPVNMQMNQYISQKMSQT